MNQNSGAFVKNPPKHRSSKEILESINDLSLGAKTLLIFIAEGKEVLDPIKIIKGLFIFSEDAPISWISKKDRYKFVPYLYGPFSKDIYTDLDILVWKQLILKTRLQGRSWPYYSISRDGLTAARSVKKLFKPRAIRFLKDIRSFVVHTPFKKLLSLVYRRYPKYAKKTIFRNTILSQ